MAKKAAKPESDAGGEGGEGAKESSKKPDMDVAAIKADVADFAAQLGLAAGSGFDDRDFRTAPKPKQPKAKVRTCQVLAESSGDVQLMDFSQNVILEVREAHKLDQANDGFNRFQLKNQADEASIDIHY
jgi:hypothetical protein